MAQTLPTKAGTTHALLIGVDEYHSFDPEGGSDLKGSRNDVLLLASYCIEVLGMRPENIVALTTPELTDQEFEQHVTMRGTVLGPAVRGIGLGKATEEEVTKRLASLLEFQQGGAALLTFSGHGAAVSDVGPVLCLGDAARDLRSGVLPLKALGDTIKHAYAQPRLIALLDCCHVEVPRTDPRLQGTSLPHSVAPEDVMKQEDLFRVSDRVLLAARPGMQAYQMRFGKLWHGALTFALVTAAERWQAENGMSHGSYKHVLKRARRTLKALGVPQKSELRMPAEERAAIRERPFLGVEEGHTVKEPDTAGERIQLDPNTMDGNGTVYTLTLSVPRTIPLTAPVLSVGTTSPGGTWKAGKEYWALPAAFVTFWNDTWPTGSSAPTLELTAATYTTASPPSSWPPIGVAITMHGAIMTNLWEASSSPPSNTLYSGSFGLTVDNGSAVTWYFRGSSAPGTAYVVHRTGATFTTTPPPPTTGTWWKLST